MSASVRYQIAVADGTPRWNLGTPKFEGAWERGRDYHRFDKGEGFRIIERKSPGPDDVGRKRTLGEIPDQLGPRLDKAKVDTVFVVRSELNGRGVLYRRHEVPVSVADQVIGWFLAHRNLEYHLGSTDCSGTVRSAVLDATGITLVGNSEDMRKNALMRPIALENVKPGDFGFSDFDGTRIHHVYVFGGTDPKYPGGPIIHDTEPSDTGAPRGWPSGTLGTGVQVRPFFDGYYCRAFFHSAARMVAVNGAP